MIASTIFLIFAALFPTNAEPPSKSADKIRPLDPFIGEWMGTAKGDANLKVKATYKKILNDSVVLYQTEITNGSDIIFTQQAMISWDQNTEMLRAWGFRSNGDRWEASWDPNKEKNADGPIWVSEFSMKNPEGTTHTGTSTKTFQGKDAYTEAITNQTLNGQKSDDLPVIEYKRIK